MAKDSEHPTRRLVAKNLQRLLKQKKWKVPALAVASGVLKNVIYPIKDEEVAATVDTLERLAAGFGCEVIEFFRADVPSVKRDGP